MSFVSKSNCQCRFHGTGTRGLLHIFFLSFWIIFSPSFLFFLHGARNFKNEHYIYCIFFMFSVAETLLHFNHCIIIHLYILFRIDVFLFLCIYMKSGYFFFLPNKRIANNVDCHRSVFRCRTRERENEDDFHTSQLNECRSKNIFLLSCCCIFLLINVFIHLLKIFFYIQKLYIYLFCCCLHVMDTK